MDISFSLALNPVTKICHWPVTVRALAKTQVREAIKGKNNWFVIVLDFVKIALTHVDTYEERV